jgi:putative addiction module killer protein
MLPSDVFQIRELLLDDGSSPFGKWFCNLDPVSAVKVQVALARIEQGNVGSIKWFEGIGEIKIHWGAGLRIYVGKQDTQIILLLGGGHKDSQDKDIKLARSRWRRFKQTKSDKEI